MKILSAIQIREADAYTIKHEPISSFALMERAGQACFNWIEANFNNSKKITGLYFSTSHILFLPWCFYQFCRL